MARPSITTSAVYRKPTGGDNGIRELKKAKVANIKQSVTLFRITITSLLSLFGDVNVRQDRGLFCWHRYVPPSLQQKSPGPNHPQG